MALQLIISAVYETVRHSWLFASVAVKYILLAHLASLAGKHELDLERYLESLRKYSDETVAGIVATGFVLAVVNYQPSALLKPVSEFAALAYFAYLFWSY